MSRSRQDRALAGSVKGPYGVSKILTRPGSTKWEWWNTPRTYIVFVFCALDVLTGLWKIRRDPSNVYSSQNSAGEIDVGWEADYGLSLFETSIG